MCFEVGLKFPDLFNAIIIKVIISIKFGDELCISKYTGCTK